MFFYILALFVIGTILLLGVKYIGKIIEQTKHVDLVAFKTSLTDDTDVLVSKYGSWKKATYTVPSGVKKVCFFTVDDKKRTCLPELDLLMCDAWESGTQNVMTEPWSETPINLTKMRVNSPNGYLCFDSSDTKVTIKITGTGNGVMISDPNT
jgi:hypothetical protein